MAMGNLKFHFFGRGKTNFLGGGITSKLLAIASVSSDHLGAYTYTNTSMPMPQPLFGAKDVCYTEKKVAK